MFIVIEGPDGAGKTSVAQELYNFANSIYEERPEDFPKPTLLRFPDNENIRNTLLNRTRRLTTFQELCLLASDFFMMAEKHILPTQSASEKTKHLIIADRYYYSTIIYQMLAVGLPRNSFTADMIRNMVLDLPTPDFLFLLTAPDSVLNARLSVKRKDVMESNGDFVNKVRYAYSKLPSVLKDKSEYIPNNYSNNIINFDSSKLGVEEIAETIYETVTQKIESIKG